MGQPFHNHYTKLKESKEHSCTFLQEFIRLFRVKDCNTSIQSPEKLLKCFTLDFFDGNEEIEVSHNMTPLNVFENLARNESLQNYFKSYIVSIDLKQEFSICKEGHSIDEKGFFNSNLKSPIIVIKESNHDLEKNFTLQRQAEDYLNGGQTSKELNCKFDMCEQKIIQTDTHTVTKVENGFIIKPFKPTSMTLEDQEPRYLALGEAVKIGQDSYIPIAAIAEEFGKYVFYVKKYGNWYKCNGNPNSSSSVEEEEVCLSQYFFYASNASNPNDPYLSESD